MAFVKNELKTIQRCLRYNNPEFPEEEEEELQGVREAFLKITVNFLKTMNQEGLADRLQSGEDIPPSVPWLFPSGMVLRVFSSVQETLPWSTSVNSSPP